MSDTTAVILALGVYILVGYGFMRGQLWLARKSLEHFPNEELEILTKVVQENVMVRIFLVTLWPIVVATTIINYLIAKRGQ